MYKFRKGLFPKMIAAVFFLVFSLSGALSVQAQTSTGSEGYITPKLTLRGYVSPAYTKTFNIPDSEKEGFKVQIEGQNYSRITDQDGFFELDAASASIEYTVIISKPNYLTRIIRGVTFSPSSISYLSTPEAPIELWAGDTAGAADNAVNMSDIIELVKVFNSAKGDAKYDEGLDFNKDTAINMSDIMIVIRSFNKASKDYPAIIQKQDLEASVCLWRGNKDCAYSLTYDDAYLISSQEKIAALSKQYNLKGTIFWDTNSAWAWDRLNAILDQGYLEIGSHSISHPFLSSLPLEEATRELEESKRIIEENTGRPCEAFAYPNSDCNADIKALASQYYLCARGGWPQTPNPATNPDFMHLGSYLNTSSTPVETLNSNVENAIAQKGWFILLSHGLDGEGWEPSTYEKMEAHYAYVNSRLDDIWSAGMVEVTKYIKEREAATVTASHYTDSQIAVNVKDTLDNATYHVPLTLRVEVLPGWNTVKVLQSQSFADIATVEENGKKVVYFDAIPDGGEITIQHIN